MAVEQRGTAHGPDPHDYPAPKGQNMTAQGTALGMGIGGEFSPERAKQIRTGHGVALAVEVWYPCQLCDTFVWHGPRTCARIVAQHPSPVKLP